MDLSTFQKDNNYIYTLFNTGIIHRTNLVNLGENAEFCHTDWDWYKIPANKQHQMKGQKDIIYLEMELKMGAGVEIWIPFLKAPQISWKMKFRNRTSMRPLATSKIGGVC